MMLKIDTKSRMKTELINHIGQVTEIFKRDLLILCPKSQINFYDLYPRQILIREFVLKIAILSYIERKKILGNHNYIKNNFYRYCYNIYNYICSSTYKNI